MKMTIKVTMAFVLAAVAMVSVVAVSVPIQEASADSNTIFDNLKQKIKDECDDEGSSCAIAQDPLINPPPLNPLE